MARVRQAVALLFCLGLTGCASVNTGKRWWNPLTWGTSNDAERVVRYEVKEERLEEEQIHSATIESFKTLTALKNPSFTPERKIEVGERLAGNTFAVLNQVSPLSFAEMQESEALVNGLLADLEESWVKQAQLEAGYGRVGEELRDTRAKLGEARKDAAEEAQENARLANELKTERLVKYASFAGNALLALGLLAYRANFMNLQTGLGNGLARLQRKFGAEDEDILALKAEIDAKVNQRTQAGIAWVVGRMV